ncbi:MAG: type II toxin-antitoxin system Phd/YefM family antitoxin [Verrucomicrobiia bacterium]|jgi:antitoxin YefM
MKSTYSVTEAQARLPALLREAGDTPVVITRHEKIAGYLLSPERMGAILETLEIMANPRAMREIRRARAGKGRYHPLVDLDEG